MQDLHLVRRVLGHALAGILMMGCQGAAGPPDGTGGAPSNGTGGSVGGQPGSTSASGGNRGAGGSSEVGAGGSRDAAAGGSPDARSLTDATPGAGGSGSGGARDAGAAMDARSGVAGAGGGTAGAGGAGGSEQPACPTSGFAWPNGAQAAVSLTYDDGLPSQLDNALPVADRLGLKITFFISEGWPTFAAQTPRYIAAVAEGHEVASHTVKHPCGTTLQSYTLQSMGQELDASIATLKSFGATGPLTFAYPCGNTTVGTTNQSYIPEVTQRFMAARGVAGVIANPKTVDLTNTPGLFNSDTVTGDALIASVTQARAQGGWVIFGFHGISATGEYLITPQPSHDALAEYLAANKNAVWTAPFRDIASYVARCR